MEISIAELSKNTDKYVNMANEQEIFITRDGMPAARLVSIENPKVKSLKELIGLLPSDLDTEKLRLERILK